MSKDRVARIDTDIEHIGRQKVIDYITKKYGAESVCRIVTFGTMAAKMAIKDVARVQKLPLSESNRQNGHQGRCPGHGISPGLGKQPGETDSQ